MYWNSQNLESLNNRYRAIFINSLAGIKQAVLVGTKSTSGVANLAIFNSLIHIGANPALYGLIIRPDTVERHSLRNILDTGHYTLNYVHADYWLKAHQTSAKYPADVSEFQAVGFSEAYLFNHFAPFVEEAHVKIGLELKERIDVASNGTILLIGSIQHISCNALLLSDDGFVHLEKATTLACAGLDAYYKTELLGRLSYAQPDNPSKIIDQP